ncbi:hypothetical protein LAZ67_1004510 [Cordylochernes scorpioides]|uniref:Uncharacterized protein n=1 Tax=Cordylochernes scorpioides TaxID=51811 RepID=A0ABY6K2C6_9ARAC|nr:hypothetical protein LAZ67_1004510 [Cordylochernes scorpioides]
MKINRVYCDRDVRRHLRLFSGHDNNNNTVYTPKIENIAVIEIYSRNYFSKTFPGIYLIISQNFTAIGCMFFESIENTHTHTRACGHAFASSAVFASGIRPSTGSEPGEEFSPENQNMENIKENSSENQKYANSPAGDMHVNLAAARGDVTAPPTAATTSATTASPA